MAESLASHPSLSEAVYRRLLRELLNGKFPAGSRLREERLCAEYGVSRTPLREALIRLSREGILDQQARRGCLVRALPEEELAELFEHRSLLERLIVTTWFGRLDRGAFRSLEARLRAAGAKRGAEFQREVQALDDEMHALIHAACPNRFLTETVQRAMARCRPYRSLRSAEAPAPETLLEERLAVVRAAQGGSAAALARALDRHIRGTLGHFTKKKT